MKPKSLSRWPLFIVVLVMAALACTCGLPFNLGETQDQQESSQIVQPSTDFGLLEEELGFVMPEMPGTTIPLETGGSLFVPEGALPQGTAINAHYTEEVPLLPEGVQPVGQSLIITADNQPASPVLLRLPIPPGVNDPDDLVLVRTTADGMTMFLGTWVDGVDLVAYTPGFSQFSIAEYVDGLFKEQRVNILGGRDLLTGQLRTVYVSMMPRDHILEAVWTVNNKATLLQQGDLSATIQAGQEKGWIVVSYSAINLTHGLRWFDSTMIEVKQPSQETDVFGKTDTFRASVTADNNSLYEDEALYPVVNFHGQFRYPAKWSYSVMDCLETVDVITTDSRPFSIPSIQCPAKSTPYALDIRAEDQDGNKTYAVLFFRVFSKPFMIQIDGPRTLDWHTGGVKGTYHIIPNDGYNNPKYSYSWRMTPGGDWSPIETRVTTYAFESIFTQPGEHRLEVRTTNGKGDEAKATLPVVVTGADPLDAHILSWPDKIQPGEDTSMTFRAGGGTLVVGGQKGGYKVSIYWGDGTVTEETNVGIIQTEYAPVIFDRSHQWAEPGPYTVMVFVEDPTGSITYTEADVTVREKIQNYQGVVEFVSYPETTPFGLGIDSDMTSILDSQVYLTVTDRTISASISLTYRFCRKYSLTRVPNQQPEHSIECFCEGIADFVFKGEGPLTNPVSLVLTQEYFTYTLGGSDCARIDASEGGSSTTLTGTFYEDGSFYGTLDPEQFVFRYFGVSANRVEE